MWRCGLTRLSGDAGHRVLPVLATRDQWSHYWGGSDVQRVGKFFEVTAVAFLGLWACYFASFFLGVATMTVIGTVREGLRRLSESCAGAAYVTYLVFDVLVTPLLARRLLCACPLHQSELCGGRHRLHIVYFVDV